MSGCRRPARQRRSSMRSSSWSRIGRRRMNDDDDAHLVETGLASHVVFAGALLEVRSDRIRLPNGGEATREFIVHPGAALVVPVLADGRLVLERQFRYPVRRVMLEFPAGKIDAGETPLATAQRELVEE